MNPSGIRSNRIEQSKRLHMVFLTVAMLFLSLHGAITRAATFAASDYRIARGSEMFDDTWYYAVAFKLRLPRALRPGISSWPLVLLHALQRTARSYRWARCGTYRFIRILSSSSQDSARRCLAAHQSTAATRGQFAFHLFNCHRDELRPGQRETVSASLRAQHTSNGGLNDTNPGMDMIGLSFALNFTG